ncbi:GIY-YIG nuclease family protein [Streptomyces sp. NPDC046942]|uniref:GIY-YIG nuclease family protein n=1 Tax=unclassified Streptomyces TaxID=2593676 RepID=UPI0033E5E328
MRTANSRSSTHFSAQIRKLESELISQLDLPLNLDQNRHDPFHGRLKEMRSQARRQHESWPSAHNPSG